MEDKKSTDDGLTAFATFVRRFAAQHSGCSKDEISKAAAARFGLRRERSVYVGDRFAVRFSAASGASFPGTVLSLSTLRKYDQSPFVVCVVRPVGIQLLLANSTFIDKLSHSSQRLTVDAVRGSFNGTNIIRAFDELENVPQHFGALFQRHLAVGFDDNYSRIVENTIAIKARGARFAPTPAEVVTILGGGEVAKALSRDLGYADLAARLAANVQQNRDSILSAAASDNVNLRGNAIEQIVTNAGNLHRTEDIVETLVSGVTVNIDVKTKLIGAGSSPKAYNIDKLLQLLAAGQTALSFFFIAIDVRQQKLATRLVSFLDATILATTRVQIHWAGRNSRGVTQLSGDLSPIFSPNFRERIDVSDARAFLQRLVAM